MSTQTEPPTAEIIKGNWNVIKGRLRQRYADLTNSDLAYIEGQEEELLGRIQKRIGRLTPPPALPATPIKQFPISNFTGCSVAIHFRMLALKVQGRYHKLTPPPAPSATPIKQFPVSWAGHNLPMLSPRNRENY